jgi:hypothetical protein
MLAPSSHPPDLGSQCRLVTAAEPRAPVVKGIASPLQLPDDLATGRPATLRKVAGQYRGAGECSTSDGRCR